MKFTGTITHLSQKGLGIVKNVQNNISYFVYGTWPGDIGEFEAIDKLLNNKKFAYAKLIRLVQPSAQRQTPVCSYAYLDENACTGCPWMIADYNSQLVQKRNRFIYAMQRVGFDMTQLTVGTVQPAPQIYGYRNRCQLKTDGEQLGFISDHTYQIAPINECIVLNDKCRGLLESVLKQLPNSTWQPDPAHGKAFIELDDDMQADEICINQKRPFRQGNTRQNEWMQDWLRQKFAQYPYPSKVVELFCGSGNFTQVIAESGCAEIMAYESDPGALKILESRKLSGVTIQSVDLFKPAIWKEIRKQVKDAHILVLDPPRAGLKKHQGFFESFIALKKILYISCNPETFSRDAWFFNQNGWSIDTIQLADLFPHTPHVEILAEFHRDPAC